MPRTSPTIHKACAFVLRSRSIYRIKNKWRALGTERFITPRTVERMERAGLVVDASTGPIPRRVISNAGRAELGKPPRRAW